MQDIIVIIGPTGVGKTKLSIELAKKIDAEIINGDSVAIYKGLDIGSAKVTEEEKENIPHHLFDIVSSFSYLFNNLINLFLLFRCTSTSEVYFFILFKISSFDKSSFSL